MSVQECIQLWKQIGRARAPCARCRAATALQALSCGGTGGVTGVLRWMDSLGKKRTEECHLCERADQIKDAFLWTAQ